MSGHGKGGGWAYSELFLPILLLPLSILSALMIEWWIIIELFLYDLFNYKSKPFSMENYTGRNFN